MGQYLYPNINLVSDQAAGAAATDSAIKLVHSEEHTNLLHFFFSQMWGMYDADWGMRMLLESHMS